ncbi:Hemerythrin HHE cation binding domain protein [Pseudoxanthomonas suwonensis 11-1]|uniref:Hemerythrin HHE cation binding domain protein n=2 Tax=Pseudoxanthomonas suwonensis TaxID=314722 RepID=E6WW48_PSEUU|nr:Hemerythrin HHE cation binding domain protein [Pseudoxanthomonas suwonensis 11-1]
MNMDRYHRDHASILQQIDTLRSLSRAGIDANAEHISQAIVETASLIKFHLAAEDQVLYPRLATSAMPEVAAISARYQSEMQGLSQAFGRFVERWRVPARLQEDPEGFRRDANTVLRALFERLCREDRELYPAAAGL